jgi:hypothetical protein
MIRASMKLQAASSSIATGRASLSGKASADGATLIVDHCKSIGIKVTVPS